MKKLLSIIICLSIIFSFAVPAFAESPEAEPMIITRSSDGERVIMQHTDVVVRSAPGTSNRKIGTLYVGQEVIVTNCQYQKVDSYWWVEIEYGSGHGYVREDLIP